MLKCKKTALELQMSTVAFLSTLILSVPASQHMWLVAVILLEGGGSYDTNLMKRSYYYWICKIFNTIFSLNYDLNVKNL